MRQLPRISKQQRLEDLSTEPENNFEREGSLLHEALNACHRWKEDVPIEITSLEYEVNSEGQPVDPEEAEFIKQEVDYVVAELIKLGWDATATLDDTEPFSRFYKLQIS